MRILCLFLFYILFSSISYAQYSDNDILLDRLVEKGYLSKGEASSVKDETEFYMKKHLKKAEVGTMPKWIQMIEIKGDIRLRSQFSKNKGVGESRQQGKVRARIGLLTKFSEQITGGIGIATSTDGGPRSTNITFENSFERGDIRLNYAYAKWQPREWISFIGGKFPKDDYLWEPTDMMWDSDINPYGGSAHVEKTFADQLKLFANIGSFVIDELPTNPADPALTYFQPGISYDNNTIDAKIVGNYYNFHNLKGSSSTSGYSNTSCTNSGLTLFGLTNCVGSVAYNFRVTGASGEIGYKQLFWDKYKRIALFGEFLGNDWAPKSPQNANKAWAYGLKFGDLAVTTGWEWQFNYKYAYIGKDAIPDILPDSDFYSGQTGVQGHNAGLIFGLSPNTTLGFQYYNTKKIPSQLAAGLTQGEAPESVYMADLEFKF